MNSTRIESFLGFSAGLILFMSGLAGPAMAQDEATVDRDWPFYNNDLLGQRFSPLKEINKTNAANLKEVCSIKVQEGGAFQASPIVVNGTMYVTTARDTVAIDPTTCKEKWRNKFLSADDDVFPNNRGVAYANGRLFRGTTTGAFFAIDAETGKQLWIDQIGNSKIGEFVSAAPVAWGGLVFTAIAGGDWGVRGRIMAFDAETGREVWRFNTIPTGAEFGADTWKNAKSALTGGGGVWTTMTLDVGTGELLVPVGNPAPDMNAEYRPGDNLFTNSIVSLDARTGKLLWHHQHKKNDSIDHDMSAAPTVFRDPNIRDIIAYAGKDGQLVALDRSTKEKIYTTPVTTVENIDAVATEKGVHVCPGLNGGVEWNGLGYDPKQNTLFAGAVDWCSVFKKGPAKYIQGDLFFGGEAVMDEAAAGWVTAVDASNGKVKWKYKTDKPVVSGITPTAGGLVFAGDTSGKFFAFDSETGKPLYTQGTPGMIAGGVITYSIKGKQYVAFTSGNVSRLTFGELGDPTVIVLALPN
ncbi:PQQ-binding-like beta-propeller repeat protein [Mesorhizobium sp. M0006]|uniref:pyrroloquinoline quinone-dependent dehydrogenase n=1 Tax=Mesorhizobium sp. M0006 TaxID=2956838 RepID=UPI00333AFC24